MYCNGVKVLYEKVREVLGPNWILITSLDYEHLDNINGFNQEGLAYPNNPWR